MKQYRRRDGTSVIAVQLLLDTEGFEYRKWGGVQTCRRGDWLVDNDGDIYTVAQDVFDRTYRRMSTGVYEKVTPVWAAVAETDGAMTTKEGTSHYSAGDYLVYNDPDGNDGYPVRPAVFDRLYVVDD